MKVAACPTVTIGITCFNARETIGAAIESALSQNGITSEILVYDDCSSDGSVALIEDYERRGLVRLIRGSENLGYPSALNSILAQATGEFVAFFDDDDVSSPHRILNQIELIRAAESEGHSLVLCYSSRMVSSESGTLYVEGIGNGRKLPSGIMVAEFILLGMRRPGYSWGEFGSCTMCCRKVVFDEVGSFDAEFRRSAEWDFAIRAAVRGATFVSSAEPLVQQHLSLGGAGEKSNSISLHYALKVQEKHASLYPNWRVKLAGHAWTMARAGWAGGSRIRWRVNILIAALACPSFAMNALSRSRFRRIYRAMDRVQKNTLRGGENA